MHQGQHRRHPFVEQVRVEARELRSREHSLVDDGAARKAGPVEAITADPRRERVAFDDPAQHEQAALERRAVEADGGDEELAQHRQRHASRSPEGVGDRGHVAPAEQAQPFGSAGLQRDRLAPCPFVRVPREHHHADPVRPERRQRHAGGLAEEGVGHLQEDAGTVTAVRLRTGRTAMAEIDERLHGLLDHRVGGSAGDPGHERHPAGVVLDGSVEQTSIRGLLAELGADTCVA